MNRFEELAERALEGELPPAEEREFQRMLDENPESWRQFRKLCDVEVELRSLDDSFDVSDRVMAACRPRAVLGAVRTPVDPAVKIDSALERWLPRIAIPLTAAAAVMISFVLMRGDPFEPARIAGIEGEVSVVRQGNSRPAERVAELKPNDRIVVPSESRTAMRYEDRTEVAVSGGTDLIYESEETFEISQAPSKKIELLAGRIEADVAPQPDGKAFVVKTPQAYAIVRGTHFSLETNAKRTRLEVTKGRVDLRRHGDEASVSVGAGSFAIADAEFLSEPRPIRSEDALLALYAFDSGSGKTVRDRSGHPAGPDLQLKTEGDGRGAWLSGGGYQLTEGAAFFSESAADRLVSEIRETGAFSVEAWVTPAKTSQAGPARIVTLSNKSENVNFLLGQDNETFGGAKSAYVLRIQTGNNKTDILRIESDNEVREGMIHLAATVEANGTLLLYENGEVAASRQIKGDFSGWKSGLKLGVGGDPGDKRYWEGTLHLVAIHAKSLTAAEVARNFESGPSQATE